MFPVGRLWIHGLVVIGVVLAVYLIDWRQFLERTLEEDAGESDRGTRRPLHRLAGILIVAGLGVSLVRQLVFGLHWYFSSFPLKGIVPDESLPLNSMELAVLWLGIGCAIFDRMMRSFG